MSEVTNRRSFSSVMVQEFAQIIPKASFDGKANAESFPDTISPRSSSESIVSPFVSKDYAQIDMEENKFRDSLSLHIENSPALTIFLLINTMIGSGILNQPYVFYQSGAIGGIIGYILASTMTWLGLVILTAAGLKCQIYEYGEISKYALGRTGEIIIDICIIIGCFGAILGYILVVGDTISGLLGSWGCHNDVCGIYFTTIISVGVFVLPVCLLRHFGHLALLSIFSVFAILCVLFLVLIGGPLMESRGSIKVFDALGTIKSLGSIIFSLSCSSANFQAFITTKKVARNRSSWAQVTAAVVIIGSIMCVAMGLAGYLSFKSSTEGIILDNFSGPQFDFFKIMVATHLILYIPVNFIIMRYSITKLAYNLKSEDLPYSTHAIITAILLFGTTGFVLFLNFIGLASGEAFSLILDLTGGVSGSITSFILPSWVFLKICDKQDNLWWLSWINFILGYIVMFAVIAITIMKYV